MTSHLITVAAFATTLLLALPSQALEVTVDTQSAVAVLRAVQNPQLSRVESLQIARLPGNQGLIRKANSYHVAATTETFADALLAAAHGEDSTTPSARALRFDQLKARATVLQSLITAIEDHPAEFTDWVVDRVSRFSLPDSKAHIEGFLIVGGSSGGFAFGEPIFFLNLAYFNEFEPARVVMAHELYHAVRGAYSLDDDDHWLKPAAKSSAGRAHQQLCANTANLFASLYQEGSASFVGDPLMLDESTGPLAKKTRNDMAEGLRNIQRSVTLLELSVVGITAKDPVPYEDIYAVGFYTPEILYKLGYTMARAIATDEGPEALAAYLQQPGYAFAEHYTRLAKYGADGDHPRLERHTLAAIRMLATGCQ